jgi:hypothetical protein
MQDPETNFIADLTGLRASFEAHLEAEGRWQRGIDHKFEHQDQYLEKKFSEIISLIGPIKEQLQENTQLLVGVSPEKDNGINGDVKKLKNWKEVVDARWMKAVAIMFAIQLIFNAAGFFLAKEGYFVHKDSNSRYDATIPERK